MSFHAERNVLSEIVEARASGVELYFRRNSWGFSTAFWFVDTEPAFEVWCVRKPPYFNDERHRPPIVRGIVHWGDRRVYESHELRCPGTYAYMRIARPSWWSVVHVGV